MRVHKKSASLVPKSNEQRERVRRKKGRKRARGKVDVNNGNLRSHANHLDQNKDNWYCFAEPGLDKPWLGCIIGFDPSRKPETRTRCPYIFYSFNSQTQFNSL